MESPALEIGNQIGLFMSEDAVQFEISNLQSPMQDFPFRPGSPLPDLRNSLTVPLKFQTMLGLRLTARRVEALLLL